MNLIPADATPTAELRAEHRVIERVLGVLERLLAQPLESAPAVTAALRDCVRFFRLFADACHHGKEEDMLFPALESAGIPRDGGPIGVMLHEHRLGRQYVARMAAELDGLEAGDAGARERFVAAARAYIDLLSAHIYKEDNVLFAMGERVTPPAAQSQLAGEFCQFRCRAFEGCTREQLAQLAEQLTQRWG